MTGHSSLWTMLAGFLLLAGMAVGPAQASGGIGGIQYPDAVDEAVAAAIGLVLGVVEDPPEPTLSPDDADGDGVPDTLEDQLCSRPATRGLINGQGSEAGSCQAVAPFDYTPPDRSATLSLPVGGPVPGADADRDGLPATVRIDFVDVTVDPFTASRVQVGLPHAEEFAVDSQDDDPNQPALSEATVPFLIPSPLSVTFQGDADGDGVPWRMRVGQFYLSFDRRDAAQPVRMTAGNGWYTVLDSNDADPNVPAQSFFTLSVPTTLSVTPATPDGQDADHDLVPGKLTVTWTDVAVDRRQANPVTAVTTRTTETSLASIEDDGDRDGPLPVLGTADADADGVVDALEPLVCQAQSESTASDGRCVRADGSGVDGSGANYAPPLPLFVDPWDGPL